MATDKKLYQMIQALQEQVLILQRKIDAAAGLEDRFVGIAKASELTGISQSALRQRVYRGQISCKKSGSRLLFSTNYLKTI